MSNINLGKEKTMKEQAIKGRRAFFINSARAVGLAALGGLVWSAYVDEATASQLLLRPPGALDEEKFLSTCIKCGLCVENCPFDTLMLAKPGDNKPVGTPYFIARDIPCYMCPDIPCVPVCPTNALDEKLVSTDGKLDINKARMGLAVVDRENCIAFWGIQCDACYRACPLMDEAITLDYTRNERTGRHTYLTPVVHSNACTGCGLCERACVTEKPAIIVLPHEVVQGSVGSHYVRGWDSADEARIQGARGEDITTEISKKDAMDSLNEMGGLFDDDL